MTGSSKCPLPIAVACLVALPLGAAVAETPSMPNRPDQEAPQHRTEPQQLAACASRQELVRLLRDNFGEYPIARGLANSGVVAEVFSSPQGTWTLVATAPNGVSCMIGAGESWNTTPIRDDSI